ncbi:MAG: HRDC domain-containing protein [Planctomycetaceae bacterium]|jgi:ribonuclease D|nr:HRDC domain-containing protein [Planctomycetaceae bacterium]
MSYIFVTQSSELRDLVWRLRDAPMIAYDTEFISEGQYSSLLCLLQVASCGVHAIIDPLAVGSLDPFWNLICDGTHEIVVHACRCEMEFCHRAIGRLPERLFDVQLAAAFVEAEYPMGFRTLLDRTLHIDLPKDESRTAWDKRPLTSRQVEYALGDVLYLEEIADHLKRQLTRANRLDWYQSEIAEIQSRLVHDFTSSRWRHISKSSSLNPRELAILREVWFWRDQVAQKRNSPPSRFLRDDLLIELARRKTSDPKRIAAVRGFQRSDLARCIPEISEAIEYALKLPLEELPPISDKFTFPQYSVITPLLHAAIGSLCKRERIASQLVAGPNDIREFIAYEFGTIPDDIHPKLMSGWRAEFVGDMLHDLLNGKTTIAINPHNDDDPLIFIPRNPTNINTR